MSVNSPYPTVAIRTLAALMLIFFLTLVIFYLMCL